MPTINQERAAKRVKEVIEKGEKIDGGDILENIGYSKSIAKNPKLIFQSKGFQEALKSLGFSVGAADMTIAKILRTGKEENQIKASQEIYKRFGAYEQGGETTSNTFIQININPPNGKGTEHKSDS